MALMMHPSGNVDKEVQIGEKNAESGHLVSEFPQSNNEKPEKRLKRQGSVSENFFAVKNAALILPKRSAFGEPTEGMKSVVFGGDLKTHLYAIIGVLRPQDKIKLVARLESWDESRTRYIVIVSTVGRQDTEESIIAGIDFAKDEHSKCTIGLVIPIWSDTTITLDGDGGFKVTGKDMTHTFKPISVQALWSAYQSIHHCIASAQKNNYYYGSLYLTWTCYYESHITSPRLFLNEWEYIEEVYCRPRYYFKEADEHRQSTELKIRESLKEVMMKMDLDNCNSRQIREALERQTDRDLKEFKEYIDTEMMTILGQMDTASEILDYLYLGSEWNASNLDELTENGVTHILNITKEVDNFFPDQFVYKNIRFHDEPTTDLLPFWNDTWKFIRKARKSNGKCLVHCKMGISRSAATVTAFIMKENRWSMDKCLSFVRERRPIVLPNKGFMLQLQEYEGILNASAQRHNFLFRSLSESNLSSEHTNPDEKSQEDVQATEKEVPEKQDDFIRKLLDLTLLGHRFNKPCHRRSKSWSVGDGRSSSSDDLIALDSTEDELSMTTGHLSEPQDFLNPSALADAEKLDTNATRLAEKRKRWKRRHTERILPFREFDLDVKPQSEDSVFVNPGSSKAEYLLMATAKGSLSSRIPYFPPSRGNDEINKDAYLEVKAPVHSSKISPKSSPSFKSAESVNVSALRSHFDDESSLRVDVTNDSSPLVLQSEQSDKLPNSSAPTTRTELEKVTAGSHSPRYGRSLSDSQVCKVKDIVSNIERREAIMESTENLHGEICWRHNRNSDAGTISTSPPPARFQLESAQIPTDVAIIEKDCNQNNNNSVMCNPSEETKIRSYSVHKEDDVQDADESLRNAERTRSLTQSELRVIREVGKTFLGEADSNDSNDLLSHQDGDHNDSSSLSTSTSTNAKSSSVKKRGIVRRMARMIESRIKRQIHGWESSGKDVSIEYNNRKSDDKIESHSLPAVDEAKSTLISNVASEGMAEISPPTDIASGTSTEAMSTAPDTGIKRMLGMSRVSDIISLVAPTPYSPPHIKHSIRRSQSERSFKHKRHCRVTTRSSAIHEPALSEDSYCLVPNEGNVVSHPTLVGVKDAVKRLEKQEAAPKSASVQDSRMHFVDSASEENTRLPDSDARPHSQALFVASEDERSSDGNNISAHGAYCWMSRSNCLYQTI